MIYLGNGIYSDSSLSHGGPWKNHKYIRIENGRYIYPGDIGGNKGKINWGAGSGSNPNNSKANNAFRRDTIKAARKTTDVDYEMAVAAQQQKFWESQKPESISSQVDFVATKKALDDVLDNQDKNGTQVSTKTYSRNAPPPEINYKDGRNRHGSRKQDKKLQYIDKYQNSVNNQEPSAAERAQTYIYDPDNVDKNDTYANLGEFRNSKNVDRGESRESQFAKDWRRNGISAVQERLDDKKYDLEDAVKGKIDELKGKKKYKDLYGTVKVTEPSRAQSAQSKLSSESRSDRSRNVSGMPRYGRPDNYKYKNQALFQGPSAAEKAQRNAVGKRSRNTDLGSKNVKYKKINDINKNKKYQKAVSSQGPSAAERAQTVRRRQAGKRPESVSRNTSKNDIRALRGQDTTKYFNKLKRESAINTMGPSAAERAQNRPLSKVSGRSRNVSTGSSIDRRYKQYKTSVQSQGPSAAEKAQRNANGGSRNVEKKPKKKKSVKSAVKSWVKKNIIGAPGKVTTHN